MDLQARLEAELGIEVHGLRRACAGKTGACAIPGRRESCLYREGFNELRCDLYNLYLLLVNTVLFGAGYAREVVRVASRML